MTRGRKIDFLGSLCYDIDTYDYRLCILKYDKDHNLYIYQENKWKPMEHKYITKEKLKQIPKLPGIYKMLDSRGVIMYIGKSKCLQNRVRSYFTDRPKWEKISRMVSMIRDIEYIVTDTHLEARLLECTLIKQYQPRFNALMKNDQRYFYIQVENYNKYHPLSITGERTDLSFGPFRSKYAFNQYLDMLKNIYPITKVDDRYELEYHMFPVTMDEDTFLLNRAILLELFNSEPHLLLLIETLQSKLEEAAISYHYELASVYRDLIVFFRMIKNGLNGYRNLISRNILLKLPLDQGYKLFYISEGSIVNSIITEDPTQDIINRFLLDSTLNIPLFQAPQENEKAWIDYRDILYSEITDLSEEMVEFL